MSSLLLEASDSLLERKPLTVGEERLCWPRFPLLLLLLLLFMGEGDGWGLRGAGEGRVEVGAPSWPGAETLAPPGVPGALASASFSSRLSRLSRLRLGESLTEELEPRPESRHATLGHGEG